MLAFTALLAEAQLVVSKVRDAEPPQQQSCAQLVEPLDSSPNRSPQAVHDALLPLFAAKEVVEVGTHAGDGLTCFAQVAKRATAIECALRDCTKLRARAAAQRKAGLQGFDVVCSDYRIAPPIDADVFTWWQHPPHLWNHRVLAELRCAAHG